MCGEPNLTSVPFCLDNQEVVGAQNDLQDEMDRVELQVMDDTLDKSGNDAGDKPIEQAEPKESVPEFFQHRYENGKRTYKSFVCKRCPRVVRVDKMKDKGRWECHECANPKSKAVYDKNRNSKVSVLS